jgi:outer membrane usher protein
VKLAVPKGVLGMLCILADPLSGAAKAAEPPATPGVSPDRTPADLVLVDVTINGEFVDGSYLVARRGDTFLVRIADLARWRIQRPAVPPVTLDGDSFVALSALPGLGVRFDTAAQRLVLNVPAGLFVAATTSASPPRVRPTQGRFQAFLNYDLSFEYSRQVTATGFIESGISDDWGLIANTMTVGRGAGTGNSVTRFDTYFLRDFPDSLIRLVVGDTVTDAPDWSRQTRFGGIRIGTEFSLQPNLVTFPTPAFTGQAALPSSVELFVNNARRFQTDVEQGAFSINQVPLVTGAGDVTLVTRDALGVERRVRSSYYVSSNLLRAGLSAWSLEGGAERRNYGVRSFDYRNPFVAGSFRRGISDRLTLGARGEASGDAQMIGGEANFIVPAIGEFGVAGAASHGRNGAGGLYQLVFRRLTPVWNVAVSYQRATRTFDQLGIDDDRDRIRKQFQASAGVSFGRFGNLAMSYADLEYADHDRTRLASANYSVGLSNRAYASMFALRSDSTDGGTDTTIGVSVTVPLGRQTSAYAQADSHNVLAELRRTPPTQGGWGYRLSESHGDTDRQQAELDWRGDPGEFSLEAARYEGDTEARLLASGGLLFAGGQIMATRRLEDGVGIVDVPGQANVRVYQENREVTRTDGQGRAIVPDLRAYEPNRIAIEPADLPLDAAMPQDMLIVVPRYRGAAEARFAVAQHHPATVVLALPDGTPMAAGTSVRTGEGPALFVGYGGEVFIEDLRPGATLEALTAHGRCRAIVDKVDPAQTLPRIGPLRCRMIGAP